MLNMSQLTSKSRGAVLHFEDRCPVHLGVSSSSYSRHVTYDGESTRQKHACALASTSCISPNSGSSSELTLRSTCYYVL